MEQICDLEAAELQKIPVKVCLMFYNVKIY